MMKVKALVLAGVVLLALTGTAAAIEPGESAIPFTIFNPSTSTNFDFPKAIAGKASLILFWNTTCGACDTEISATNEYLHNNPKAFELILIAIDSSKDAKTKVDAYIRDKKITAVSLLDPKFEIAEKYGFAFTPAAVGFGKDGKALFVLKGFSRRESGGYNSLLDKLAGK